MKFRNLLAMIPVLAAYSCTFDESGLPGGRLPQYDPSADARAYTLDDGNNRKSKDKGLDSLITKKEDSGVDSGIPSKDAGLDLGVSHDMGRDAPYSIDEGVRSDAGVSDLGRRDLGTGQDLGRDFGAADVYRPDMGRDAITIFPDIIIRPFDLGSDARDGSLDLGVDGLSRDLGLDGIVADASRDMGPDGPVLPRPYECDENTVVLYHFNQPEPFVDSCRSHNLTNNGTTESSGQPGFGQARNFNNRSYLETADAPDLNFGSEQDFTFEVRARISTNPQSLDFMIGKLPSGSPASGYGIFYYEAGWCCPYWDAGATYLVNSRENLVDEAWHEIACVRDNAGRRITMYIDGEPVVNGEIPLANVNTPAPLVIGNSQQGIIHGWGSYAGDIDEVRISDVARTFVPGEVVE